MGLLKGPFRIDEFLKMKSNWRMEMILFSIITLYYVAPTQKAWFRSQVVCFSSTLCSRHTLAENQRMRVWRNQEKYESLMEADSVWRFHFLSSLYDSLNISRFFLSCHSLSPFLRVGRQCMKYCLRLEDPLQWELGAYEAIWRFTKVFRGIWF